MTNKELQELIDVLDEAVEYLPSSMETDIKIISNLLVDLPEEVVETLQIRK